MSAPAFGLLIAVICILAGWGMMALTVYAGHTFWLVLGVLGFPLVAPFAAIGTYEVSRRLSTGQQVKVGDIAKVLWLERGRQMPLLSASMVVVLLFWFFLGHMIFALFLGLKPMTNIMTSADVFLSGDGLIMLGMGTVVGACFALLLYSVCVVGLPMLLDREVDYVTALINSIGLVVKFPVLMIGWAAFIAIVLFVAMVPMFLGLIIVLPWLGSASWHVYDGLKED